MGTPVDDLHQQWQHAWAFNFYQQNRDPVAPAIERLVQPPLSNHVPRGGTVVEVGAGAGALRHYAGGIGDRYNWIETDQNPDFLALPRKHASTLLQLVLPNLAGVKPGVDAVVGLGVFDTLSLTTLRAAAESSREALRVGGVVMHWLDMSPDYSIDIRINAEQGLFPIPFTALDGQTGIHYLELDGLIEKISQLSVDLPVRQAFVSLITRPQETLPHLNRTAILTYLGHIAKENGLVVRSDSNWMNTIGERCRAAWEAVGFTVVKNEVITATRLQNKKVLAPEYRNMTYIRRRQGVLKTETGNKDKVPSGKVKLSADAHLFIARKDG